MKKTHSHPSPWVTGPPISKPEVTPTPPIPPQMPSALLRSDPSSNTVIRRDSALGDRIAAAIPWSTRAPTRISSDHASPQRKDEPAPASGGGRAAKTARSLLEHALEVVEGR